jgi:undecaprenyl-diphosphatase
MTARTLVVALVAAIAYVALGLAVRDRPPQPLWPIDTLGATIGGRGTHVALVFTESCWWPALLALGAGVALLGWRVPAFRARAVYSIVVTIVAWQTSDALKNAFARTRPTHWLLHHEDTYAYSSGHAMFAVVVYFLWSYFFATSPLPKNARTWLSTACALWGCGVLWSRLALGAHWTTDLVGGILLGITMLCMGAAIAWSLPPLVTPSGAPKRA